MDEPPRVWPLSDVSGGAGYSLRLRFNIMGLVYGIQRLTHVFPQKYPADAAVTDENKEEFIQIMTEWRLKRSIQDEVWAAAD